MSIFKKFFTPKRVIGVLTAIVAALLLATVISNNASADTTGTAPPPGAINCTQGQIDYGIHALTVSSDWEPPGSCGWQLRTCVEGTDGVQRCGGWVKATELVTTSPQAFGMMVNGWLEDRVNSSNPDYCWNVFPHASTQWKLCP